MALLAAAFGKRTIVLAIEGFEKKLPDLRKKLGWIS